MFRERVDRPINPIPQAYADSLRRLANEPDYSLTCLGVALLKTRIDDYNGISGAYCTFESKAAAVGDFIERVKNIDTYPLYCYYIYNSDQNSADVEEIITNNLPEFKKRGNITAFIKEKSDSDCTVLYHEVMNAVGIFVNSRDFRMYHLLMSFLPLYYPALFADKKMTDEDYNLVKSLSNKEKDRFYAAIQNLIRPYTAEFRRLQLGTLIKNVHETKIRNALSEVNTLKQEANNLEQQYGRLMTQIRDAVIKYEGMKAVEQYDAPEEDLVEYLSTNRNIYGLEIENQVLTFSVTTLLNNFNEEAWKSYSSRGSIFDGEYGVALLDTFKKRDNRKILLDAIFSEDPELYIRMAGNYKLDLDHCRIYTNGHYNYEAVDPVFKDYMPNPHLKIFECLGGYKDRIMPALRNGEYISAVEICMASAGSINLDEVTQTFRPFLGWVLTSTNKIIQTKDGTAMTPEEALVWLIDQKEKKDETD